MSGDPSDQSGTGTRAGDRLLANKKRILDAWVKRLREEVPAARRESEPVLIDTIPAVLRQLGEALSPQHPRRTATEGSTVAEEHGGERVRVTHYRLEDLIEEYGLLRQVLVEILEENEALSAIERNTLHASIDQAVLKSCAGYTLVQAEFRDHSFAVLAHDLRGPLAAARANASLILRKPGAEQVPRWAARSVDNLDRVDRMLQDLLDAMRLQTGARLELHLEECDLVEIARASLEHLEAQHGERFVLVAPEPVRGHFAAEPLRRAIENLATNAEKYGALNRPITVTVRQTHGRAFLMVHNHGAPIPAAEQETLFRAFQRTRNPETARTRGWGLGLSQARGVAEAHGGSIAVDSLPERGTTFTIDIPVDARPFQEKPVHLP